MSEMPQETEEEEVDEETGIDGPDDVQESLMMVMMATFCVG